MFINPKVVIENKWITGIHNPEKQIQPNAIDFTADVMKRVKLEPAYVGETTKQMREIYDIPCINNIWRLDAMSVYDVMSDMYVEVPEGMCAILFTRSTFTRNGIFITSGLYDTGFKGHVGCTIYTFGGQTAIERGTRIGQIAFFEAQNAHVYQGGWNHQQGTHYTELAKTLEQATTLDGMATSKPAGKQTFI
jgi:deoxycytidine triphosphate deaminase